MSLSVFTITIQQDTASIRNFKLYLIVIICVNGCGSEFWVHSVQNFPTLVSPTIMNSFYVAFGTTAFAYSLRSWFSLYFLFCSFCWPIFSFFFINLELFVLEFGLSERSLAYSKFTHTLLAQTTRRRINQMIFIWTIEVLDNLKVKILNSSW